MMKKMAVMLTGSELNDRLDAQIRVIERISMLLEDARLDANDELALDGESAQRLWSLISAYDAFLGHFRDTSEDTAAEITRLTTAPGHVACDCAEDGDADLDEE